MNSKVNNATTALATKASQSDLTILNNQVNDSNTGLATKASQADFNTLNNQVNNATTGLATKASKAEVSAAKTEVDAGKNINVTTSTGSSGQTVYTVKTADDVNFNTLTTTGNTTVGGSLTVTGTANLNNGANLNNKKITGVAEGTTDSDAVNFGQIKNLGINNTYDGVKYFRTNSTKADAKAIGVDSTAIGPLATANSDSSIAIGNTSSATGVGSISIGKNSQSLQDGSVAVGQGTATLGKNSTSVGSKGAERTLQISKNNVGTIVSINGIPVEASGPNETDITKINGIPVTQAEYNAIKSVILSGANTSVGANSTAVGTANIAGGTSSVALGSSNSAGGLSSVAIGDSNIATGNNSTSIGTKSSSTRASAISVGNGAVADSTSGISIGENAGTGTTQGTTTDRVEHIAIGKNAGQNVFGNQNIAIGSGAGTNLSKNDTSSSDSNIAIGIQAGSNIEGDDNISIGRNSNVNSGPITRSVSLGSETKSSSESVVIGDSAKVSNGPEGTVIGSSAEVTGTGGVALGAKTKAAANNIALGVNSDASVNSFTNAYLVPDTIPNVATNGYSVVSVGNGSTTRRITNVAPGGNPTDAVNVSQLTQLHNDVSSILGLTDSTDSKFGEIEVNGTKYSSVAAAIAAGGGGGPLPSDYYVTYTNASQNEINLGLNGGKGTTINNVATATNDDQAVNLGQVKALAQDATVKYVSIKSTDGANKLSDQALGNNSLAIGPSTATTSTAKNSVALGSNVQTEAENSIAIGNNNTRAKGENSIALGKSNTALDENNIALGNLVSTKGKDSIGIGKNVQTDQTSSTTDYAVAIGSDAEVQNADQAIVIGRKATVEQDNGIAIGHQALSKGEQAIALGRNTTANGANSAALGTLAETYGENAYALGTQAEARAQNAYSLGNKASTDAENAFAIGNSAAVGSGSGNATAIGSGATVNNNATDSIAVGSNATISNSAVNGIAIGKNAKVESTNPNAIALGSNSISGNANATSGATINGRTYTYAGTTPTSTLSIGSAGNERQIINVAAGRVNATSTDAINGSQLFAVQEEVQKPLSFTGDTGTKVDRKLGDQLKVSGGASGTLTENNIGVVANGSDTLQLKLAKDVNLTSAGSLTVGTTKLTDGKVEIKDASNNSHVSTSTNTVMTAGASTNTMDANSVTLKNAANNVVLSGTTGTLTGLTNKTLTVPGFATQGRAATEEQLKLVNDTANKGWNLTTNKDTVNKSNVAPDATVDFSNSDKNITVSHSGTNVDLKLAEVVNIGGQPGGATISVNGKNGTITGLTNKTFDPNNYTTGRAATEDQLATPLTFNGDNAGVNVQRKLGQQLSIVGGESVSTNLTDNNIGVVADSTNNKLTVKLSKDIKLNSVNAAGTVIDDKGLTFVDASGGAVPNSPSVSKTGINAGTNKITNVAAGAITDTSMDAVNGSQIKGIIDKGFTVSSNGNTAAKDTIALGENVDFSATDSNIKVTNTGNNQITFGLEPVVKVGPTTGGNPVTINGNTGEITGLTNKTTTSSDFATVGRAATEEQLKTLQTGLTDSGFGLKAADSNTVNKKLGETIDIVGADSNITTKVVNGQVAVELSKNIDLSKAGSLTVGNSKVTDGKVELKDGAKLNSSTVDGTVVSDGTNTTTIGVSQITVGAGSNPVVINGTTGRVSGLTNTTWDPNATYNQKQAATEEQLKSVSDVAQNANKGWNIKSDSTLNSTQVKPGDTVDVGLENGENNLKVAATNSNGTTTIDFSLSKDLLLNSVNAGGTVIDNSGLRFVDPVTGLPLTNTPSISWSGISAGRQIISNVAPGKNGTDAVNVDQLNGVKQIAEQGWIFTTATQGKGQTYNSSLERIHPNEILTLISGDNIELDQNEDKVTITTTPEVSFDKVNVGNVVIDKTTNKITGVEAGTVAANSKDAVNGSQLHDLGSGVQNIIGGNTTYDPSTGTYTNNNIGDTGQNNINDAIKSINDTAQNANKGWTVSTNGQNASQVKPTDTVDFANKDGNIKVNNTGNNITVDLAKDIKVDSVTAGDTTVNNNGLTINGGPSVTKNGIDAAGNKVTGVAEGSIAQGSKDAVNGSQIHDIIGDGAFQGGDGNTITNIGGTGATNINDAIGSINQKAGQHSTVEAGQNITVKESTNSNGGKEYTVATADDVKFNSVTSNTVTANNVKVGDVNIDQNGINAGNHKITNVAPGEVSSTSKDAVNGSQLNTSNQYIVNSLGGGAKYENGEFTAPTYNVNNGSYNNVGDALGALNQADINLGDRITNLGDRVEQIFNNVNGRIDDVEKKANAGIAAALALEAAPFIAGKYTYAVGGAYHGGENAVGATLRKTSDNGRWSITGGIAAASQGDPSFRVGFSGVID